MARTESPPRDNSQNLIADVTGADSIALDGVGETMWVDVIKRMDEVYSELLRNEADLERKQVCVSQLINAHRFLGVRVAALDPGKVRVGVAVSDELGVLAHPRPALDARNRAKLLASLRNLAEEEQIERFLVGVPLDRDGLVGAAARQAQTFASQVHEATGRPIELFDERLSTVEATRRLHEGGMNARQSRHHIDSASACVLLQAWLNARCVEQLP